MPRTGSPKKKMQKTQFKTPLQKLLNTKSVLEKQRLASLSSTEKQLGPVGDSMSEHTTIHQQMLNKYRNSRRQRREGRPQFLTMKLLTQTTTKLIQDLLSVKVWVLLSSIGLLVHHFLTGANFTTIVGFVLAGRGYDKYVTTNSTES